MDRRIADAELIGSLFEQIDTLIEGWTTKTLADKGFRHDVTDAAERGKKAVDDFLSYLKEYC